MSYSSQKDPRGKKSQFGFNAVSLFITHCVPVRKGVKFIIDQEHIIDKSIWPFNSFVLLFARVMCVSCAAGRETKGKLDMYEIFSTKYLVKWNSRSSQLTGESTASELEEAPQMH